MQTQCPHCATRFRVTESQVNTADGYVRCSVCKEVFNAIEVAEQDERQHTLLAQDLAADSIDTTDDTALAEQQRSSDAELEDHIKETATEAEPGAVAFDKITASDEQHKDSYDFFDEESNESLPHVVPEKYKDAHDSDSPALLSSLLWGAGTLLLTATLLIEYAWFNRDQLNQIPQLRAWSEMICQQIDCRNISMRDPAKIELISRNVYSHPNEKGALMVNVTMKNHAEFAQPYPVMQIHFSDVRGGSVAARRFLPGEYLPKDMLADTTDSQLLLEPETNMTFTMEIQDPGKHAMTYEFDFL
ncbi:MAG: DUF3426 domain-containing protein [Gammaproteobacteria bacterium]|nr:DUF3426 domain-containing protein [Gammaproteobacteria bacterium]